MPRKPIIAAAHGILSGITSPSWTADLAAFCYAQDAGMQVIESQYHAGPAPWLNVMWKNRRIARFLADEVMTFAKLGAPVNFVSHSNGADVVLKCIRILAARGIRTQTAVFIAGAIAADVRTRPLWLGSGIADLIRDGNLRRAFAYCSRDDAALGVSPLLLWPYGNLGRLGFQAPDRAGWNLQYLTTRWQDGGHGAWFAHKDRTFAQVLADICAP